MGKDRKEEKEKCRKKLDRKTYSKRGGGEEGRGKERGREIEKREVITSFKNGARGCQYYGIKEGYTDDFNHFCIIFFRPNFFYIVAVSATIFYIFQAFVTCYWCCCCWGFFFIYAFIFLCYKSYLVLRNR